MSPKPVRSSRAGSAAGPGARPTGGFTLVELLVSLAVAGLVIAAAHGAIAFTIDAWARARADRAGTLASAGARATLVRWIGAAAVVEHREPFRGRPGAGGLPHDQVSFMVRDGGALHPGPHRVRLWVDRDPGTPRQGLLAELAPLQPWRAPEVDTVAVAPAALGVSFRYLATTGGRPEWRTSWDSDRELPLAVELRLTAPPVAARSGGLPPLLGAPLLVRVAAAAP